MRAVWKYTDQFFCDVVHCDGKLITFLLVSCEISKFLEFCSCMQMWSTQEETPVNMQIFARVLELRCLTEKIHGQISSIGVCNFNKKIYIFFYDSKSDEYLQCKEERTS